MTELVEHAPYAHRFFVLAQGQRCVLDYEVREQTMVITHTFVPAVLSGKGIAAALTDAALRWARAEQLRVLPQCSYSAAYLDQHPEWQDLRS